MTATYYQVKIVASDDAAEAADALYAEFGTWSGALLTIGGQVLQGQGENLTDEQRQLLISTDDVYLKLLGLSNDFIAVGRDDMASELDE